ncbi:MAG TPA: S41 family peptidase [Pyrinomonadaceae bacterium]|jgi:C-terminal processing protease CtpA/Prc
MKKIFILPALVLVIFTFKSFSQATSSAITLKASRLMYQNILKTIKDDIKNKYFDSNLGGVDIEGNSKKAGDLINEAKSIEEMADIIARFLYPFNDSHLFFMPPSKTTTVEYGWEMMFVGDKVFITKVEEDSDAYKKGVRVGDQIYMVEGYIPARPEFWMFRYHFNILRPQPVLSVILIKPSGNKFKVELQAKVTRDSVFMPSRRDRILEYETRYQEKTRQLFSDDVPGLAIWKMQSFELTELQVDKMMDKARKNEALILDLRSNEGGYYSSLAQLASNFFASKITVGEIKERKGLSKMVIEPRGKNIFNGKLVVLIDSDSASAAELFARIIQLEKRGTVIGDQSSGAVMASVVYQYEFGLDTKIPYALSLTVADLTMKDGQRLEKIGVAPDEKILPTAADLANKRDPVLARAAEILGFKMTPEQAGAIFAKK